MKNFLKTLRRSLILRVAVLLQLAPGLVMYPVGVSANPSDGVVVIGDVNFQGLGTANLDINNLSQHAVIDWQSFSIGVGEVTTINQAANAHTLNRVVSSNPSEIYGMLKAANGGVTVINRNGIMVGAGGQVDIAGMLTLSTLDISNNDFLNGGSNQYQGDSSAGISNYGSISSRNGDVVVLGNFLQNAGSVSAPDGTVAFGAGGDIIVDQGAGGLISVRGGGAGGETGIENTGSINAASAELKAHGNVYALAIKNNGLVRASGYSFKGGRLSLSAGSSGRIVNNGQLQARNRDGSGGQVQISGGNVALASGSVDAAGETGQVGGSVDVSGSEVTVGATAQVTASGSRGGSVKLSSSGNTAVNGQVAATGAFGAGGQVVVEGTDVAVGSQAAVDVSGDTRGGSLKIGGGFQGNDEAVRNATTVVIDDGALLRGDAKGSGIGGQIIVWADGDTLFQGEISATGINGGGFVEVSGRERLGFDGLVSTASADGRTGILLLDPTNVIVSTAPASAAVVNVTALQTALASNSVIISTNSALAETGNVTFSNAVTWSSANSLSVLAHGSVAFNASVQGTGSGDLNVVAGWDGTTGLSLVAPPLAGTGTPPQTSAALNIADFTGNSATYGNSSGNITVGNAAAATSGIAVGSRNGTTTLLANNLTIAGRSGAFADRFAQVGFRDVSSGGAATGNIRIDLKNNLTMTAGANASALRNYAQIGHGGADSDTANSVGNLSGNIQISATNTIAMTGAASGNQNYVQIGHGGFQSGGTGNTKTGNITVQSTSSTIAINGGTVGTDAYARVGHGGTLARGVNTGDISVQASGQVALVSGQAGARTYTQIGHGGHNAAPVIDLLNPIGDANTGDITVISQTANIDARWAAVGTNTSSETYTQIGHGGFLSDPLVSLINAGGHNSGDIKLLAGTNILVRSTDSATNTNSNYAQVGHGGVGWIGNHGGDIAIRAGTIGVTGTITFNAPNLTTAVAGTLQNRYVQLGHGGFQAKGDHSGNISALALGNISFRGGRVEGGYAQLGHGGRDADDETTAAGNTGDIRVASQTGNITFQWSAANVTPGSFAYVQLGHGGYQNSGSHSGDTFVRAGGLIQFRGGTGNTAPAACNVGNYAQLGHGGFEAAGNHSGDLTVSAGTGGIFRDVFDVNMNDIFGEDPLDDVLFTSSVTPGTITFLAGGSQADRYTQLGHGGRLARGDHSGKITVNALGDIVFRGGTGARGYAMIGHGGDDADSSNGTLDLVNGIGTSTYHTHNDPTNTVRGPSAADRVGNSGNIVVESMDGNVTFNTGTGNGSTRSAVQIGHGGAQTDGDHVGHITVLADVDKSNVATGGSITFATNGSGNATQRFAQIGHGGYLTSGGHTGNLIVTAGAGITFTGGGAADRYVQIGHGGRNDHRVNRSNAPAYPNPDAPGTNYAQMFNQNNANDLYFSGTHSGSITVTSGGAVAVTTVSGDRSYAQVGHGGFRNAAEAGEGHNGEISVVAVGAVTFTGGSGAQGYAQVGHGGYEAFGNHGYQVVRAQGGLNLGIGTVSLGNTSVAAGSVRITRDPDGMSVEGTVVFTDDGAGNLIDPGDALGLGANAVIGAIDYATGAVVFTVDASEGMADPVEVAYLHGGSNILVDSGAGVTFSAGGNTNAYAQVGHGGHDSAFSTTRNIQPEEAHTPPIAGVSPDPNIPPVQVNNTSNVTYHLNTPTGSPVGTSGNITVEGGTGAITFTAGTGQNTTGNAGGTDTYAQIGNGGRLARGDHRGDIMVTGTGDINFKPFNVGATSQTQTGTAVVNLNTALLAGTGTFTIGQTGDLVRDNTFIITYTPDPALPQFSGTIVGNGTGGLVDSLSGQQVGTISTAGVIAITTKVTTVATVSSVTFTHFNTGDRSYVQIGHGGYDADSSNGVLDLTLGIGTSTYYPDNDPTNLNRGPSAAERVGNSGNIFVESIDGSVLFSSGSRANTYSQIGHGGGLTDGDQVGDITVKADSDGSNASGGGGQVTFLADAPSGNHYGQIGHGGYLASGGHIGNLIVDAGAAITFTGGGANNYVQIGHGGRNDHRVNRSNAPTYANPAGGNFPQMFNQNNANDRYYPGTHSGTIDVTGGGAITFTGGTGTAAYGQIGHGGFRNAAESNEGHHGEINVIGGGLVSFTGQGGADAYLQIGHGGSEAFGNHGYQVVRAEGGFDVASQMGSATLANTAVAPRSVSITRDADDSGAGRAVFTDDGLGNLIDPVGVLGNANAVVGTINYVTGDVVFTVDVNPSGDEVAVAYLHGGSDILVDGGAGVTFSGGTNARGYAQIGHGGFDSALLTTRNIDPEEAHTPPIPNPAIVGGQAPVQVNNTSTTTYHLNTPTGSPVGTSGNITVDGGTGAIRFTSGSAEAQTGNAGGTDAYAQIGNGGRLARGDHRGDIAVNSEGDIAFKSSTVGVTSQSQTSATLNTRLTAGGNFTVTQTGNVVVDNTFVITYSSPLAGFSGTIVGDGFGGLIDSVSLVKVGTVNSAGVISITTPVSSAPAATVTYNHFNTGQRAYVQIGHGGSDADFPTATTAGNPGNTGDIEVISAMGSISFIAGSRAASYAQVGHGGNATNGDHRGSIVIEATLGAITGTAGSANDASVQFGHGGRTSRGDSIGTIDVTSFGNINFSVLADTAPRAAVRQAQTNANLDLRLFNGTGSFTIGQTDNFVRDSTFRITYLNPEPGFSGVITGDATGSGALLDSVSGVQVGTISAAGVITMTTKVMSVNTTTPATLEATVSFSHLNDGVRTYAQIGHGGHDSDSPTAVTPGDPGNSADIQVSSTNGSIAFTGGERPDNYVQIGNGGAATNGDQNGIIIVDAFGDLRFGGGGGNRSYAQLGHGGHASDGRHGAVNSPTIDPAGDITVTTGGIVEFIGGTPGVLGAVQSYAQLGHGGTLSPGTSQGNIIVNAGEGLISGTSLMAGIAFIGGGGVDTYSLLGHGGNGSPAGAGGVHAGDITVDSVGDVVLLAGTTSEDVDNPGEDGRNFAKVGHGGTNSGVNNNVYVGGFGHAGTIAVTSSLGDIVLLGGSLTNLSLGDGFGRYHYAQIGHGGLGSVGDHRGNITVVAEDGSVILRGGESTDDDADNYNYAVIGHGGASTSGNTGATNQSIKVFALGATSDVVLQGGAGTSSMAQIGNGVGSLGGIHRGLIKVIAVNDLLMDSDGVGATNFSKIGHGERDSAGALRSGDILVSLGNDAVLDRALIGHLDFALPPAFPVDQQGDTFIAVSRIDPETGGSGTFTTTSETRISSAGGGSSSFNDELRLYMPDDTSNLLAEGTVLNGSAYTRIPAPGSGRLDEQFETEHTFPAPPVTEADAAFTAAGLYPDHTFGEYNLYYAVVPVPPIVIPGIGFIGYDSYDRSLGLFGYDGYDGMLYSVALGDGVLDEADPATGNWFLEELADGLVGSRRDGIDSVSGEVLDEERDEELERRQEFASRKVGKVGLTYYVFSPGTNRYSSYRLFGVPRTTLPVASPVTE